jgi:hypothetical protein
MNELLWAFSLACCLAFGVQFFIRICWKIFGGGRWHGGFWGSGF